MCRVEIVGILDKDVEDGAAGQEERFRPQRRFTEVVKEEKNRVGVTEGYPRDGMKWRQMSCFCDGSSQKKKKERRYGIAPTNPKVSYMTSNSAII